MKFITYIRRGVLVAASGVVAVVAQAAGVSTSNEISGSYSFTDKGSIARVQVTNSVPENASELFVTALMAHEDMAHRDHPDDRLSILKSIRRTLQTIVSEHADTEVGGRLASGLSVGGLSVSSVDRAIRTARLASCEATPTPSCIFRAAFDSAKEARDAEQRRELLCQLRAVEERSVDAKYSAALQSEREQLWSVQFSHGWSWHSPFVKELVDVWPAGAEPCYLLEPWYLYDEMLPLMEGVDGCVTVVWHYPLCVEGSPTVEPLSDPLRELISANRLSEAIGRAAASSRRHELESVRDALYLSPALAAFWADNGEQQDTATVGEAFRYVIGLADTSLRVRLLVALSGMDQRGISD